MSDNLHDDEIDLRKLVMVLWHAKALIAAVTLGCALIGVGYAFLSKPVYEAEAQTLPPPAGAVAGYNAALRLLDSAQTAVNHSASPENSNSAVSTPPLTTDDVYQLFLQRLQSKALQRRFFGTHYLSAHSAATTEADRQALWEQLDDDLTVTLPKKDLSQNQVTITLEGRDPQQLADWTNIYLQMASDNARQQLLDQLARTTQTQIQSVTDQIAALRDVARTSRKNEISRLGAALDLARKIGLETPPTTGNLITSYTGGTLYLRGSKALLADLEILKTRESDDPYIPQLPDLLYAQQLLQRISTNVQDLQVVAIDQPARAPVMPKQPRKALAIAVAILLGLMLGVFFVLLRQAWLQPDRSSGAA